MSDLMAVITVNGEKLICVDFDRPVWYSKSDKSLSATPSLEHFVVDGILSTASKELLKKYGITQRFDSSHFENSQPSQDLQSARQNLYKALDLVIDYYHDLEGDIQIHQDLARFKMPLGNVNKVSTQELHDLAK